MTANHANDVVICSAARTPIGKFLGAFSTTPATVLGSVAIASAVQRAGLRPDQIDEVLMGCVLSANLGQAPARQALLGAGLPPSVCATTVNKVCGSGLKSVMLAADGLARGNFSIAVAGGMECMSKAPFLVPTGRLGQKAGHVTMLDHMMKDGLEDAYEVGRAMGTFAEDMARSYGFRREEQDAYALESVLRAQRAVNEGLFDQETVTVTPPGASQAVSRDEIPGKIDPIKIPRLKPAFAADGTVTAASSSANGDAAAAIVLTTRATADRHGLPILASLRAQASFARKPQEFTLAPTGAVQRALQRVDWKPRDVDLFEINEAFAVVVMGVMRDLGIRHDQVNVLGGACALGQATRSVPVRCLRPQGRGRSPLCHCTRNDRLPHLRGVACYASRSARQPVRVHRSQRASV